MKNILYLLINHVPVTHPDRSRTNRSGLGVVRDHNDRLVELLVQPAKHFQHDLRILRVQVPGRLVRQNDGGAVDDRTRQSHPLLFAARKLERLVMHFILQFQKPQNLSPVCRVAAAVAGMDLFGKFEITLGRKCRKQIESLENEPDLAAANVGALCVGDF